MQINKGKDLVNQIIIKNFPTIQAYVSLILMGRTDIYLDKILEKNEKGTDHPIEDIRLVIVDTPRGETTKTNVVM